MKIKLITYYSGPTFSAVPGTIVEFSEAEGKSLVAGGYGTEVKDCGRGEKYSPPATTSKVRADADAGKAA